MPEERETELMNPKPEMIVWGAREKLNPVGFFCAVDSARQYGLEKQQKLMKKLRIAAQTTNF